MRLSLFASAFVLALGVSAATSAHADEDFKNLKVLKNNGKDLEKGMKAISKGLGVKCTACHVKGEFDSDKVPAKDKTRAFFTAVVGEKDQAKKDAAAAELIKNVEGAAIKDAKAIWEGVALLQKQ